MLEERCKTLVKNDNRIGPVVYWMQRDQRAVDNWALIKAQHCAMKMKQPLIVALFLQESIQEVNPSYFDFMIKGLIETANYLKEKSIPLVILVGKPEDSITQFLTNIDPGLLITDLNPLRVSHKLKENVSKNLGITFIEVDAHNIVPVFKASDKQEFGAYTIRPKINRLLETFLVPFTEIIKHPFEFNEESKSFFDRKFTT